LVASLLDVARELGYRVRIRDLPDGGAGGWCDPKRHEIVVASDPANPQVRTADAELAEAVQPGKRTLDNPPRAPESRAVLGGAPGDDRLHAAATQFAAVVASESLGSPGC
jgi:hypothetical protein